MDDITIARERLAEIEDGTAEAVEADDYIPVADRLDAIMERILAERRAWPLWRKVWMKFRWKVVQPLRRLPRQIKWYAQRARRGWADYDMWGADYYIARVNAELMADLRKWAHGHPMGLGTDSIRSWGVTDERYAEMVAEIEAIDAKIGYDGPLSDGFERWKAMLTYFEDGWRAYLRFTDTMDPKDKAQFTEMLPLYGEWFDGLWD